MCFSAHASFIAAITLSTLGVATLCKAKKFKIKWFAAIPLVFGLQQAIEGIVWLTINHGDTTSFLHTGMVYGFMFFASIFWPIYIPFSLYMAEESQKRKKLLGGTFLLGVIVASGSFLSLIVIGIKATVVDHHIAYGIARALSTFSDFLYPLGLLLYLIAVVGSTFISSIPYMWTIGLLAIGACLVVKIAYYAAFGSVWCFFEAVASIAVYYFVMQYVKNEGKRDTLKLV